MGKPSDTGGVKPMSIEGRMGRVRERCIGMTDEERAYRKQWLKDQVLSQNEPREVPELYKSTHNPIRRFYRWPLDQMQKALEPKMGKEMAHLARHATGRLMMGIVGIYMSTYYFLYNGNDWTRQGGWRCVKSRKAVYEGDANYPGLSDRTKGADYASRGFKDVTLDL